VAEALAVVAEDLRSSAWMVTTGGEKQISVARRRVTDLEHFRILIRNPIKPSKNPTAPFTFDEWRLS
jgi:hypothetical protein